MIGLSPRRWWSGYARLYDRVWAGPLTDELAVAVASRAGAVEGYVLDAGTGTGLVGTRIAGARQLVGIDTNPSMLARAARYDGTWILADACHPPFAPGAFGVVVAANVVHLCEHPVRLVVALARLVRPGGCLVLCWPADHAAPWPLLRSELRRQVVPFAALARLIARLLIAWSALSTRRLRRVPTARIWSTLVAVADAERLACSHDTVLDGLQHVAVLTRSP